MWSHGLCLSTPSFSQLWVTPTDIAWLSLLSIAFSIIHWIFYYMRCNVFVDSRKWWLSLMYCPLSVASLPFICYALSGPFYDHLPLYWYGPCYWHTDFITPFMKPTLLSSLYIVVALHSGLDLRTIYISLCCRHGLHFVVVFLYFVYGYPSNMPLT